MRRTRTQPWSVPRRCHAGRTRTSSARVSVAAPYEAGDRGPLVTVVDYGLKANIVRSLRRRGARVRVLPHTATRSGRASSGRGRGRAVARSGRSEPARRPDGAGASHHRRRPATPGHLPRPSDRGPRGRCRDTPAALRASRRQPSGGGPGHGTRPGHGPEPRGDGRRRTRCRLAPGSRSASAT